MKLITDQRFVARFCFKVILIFSTLQPFCYDISCQRIITPQPRWSIEDGLPTNNCTAVYEDSKGHIWAGTTEGLVRFNGKFFEVPKTESNQFIHPPGLSVVDLYEDTDGYLWVLTREGGVSKINIHRPDSGFQAMIPPVLFPVLQRKALTTPILWAKGDEVIISYLDTIRIYRKGVNSMKIWNKLSNHPIFINGNPIICKPNRYSNNIAIAYHEKAGIIVFSIVDGKILYEVPDTIFNDIRQQKCLTRIFISEDYTMTMTENGQYWIFNWRKKILHAHGRVPLAENETILKAGPLPQGQIIYSTELTTFFLYDPLTKQLIDEKEKLYIRDSVYALFKGMPMSRSGYLFIISNYGLFKYVPGTEPIRSYSIPYYVNPYSSESYIQNLFCSNMNKIWGLWNQNIYHFNEKSNRFNEFIGPWNKKVKDFNYYLFGNANTIFIKSNELYSLNTQSQKIKKIQLTGRKDDLQDFSKSKIEYTAFYKVDGSDMACLATRDSQLFFWNLNNNQILKLSLTKSRKERIAGISNYKNKYIIICLSRTGLYMVPVDQPLRNIFIPLSKFSSDSAQTIQLSNVATDRHGNIWLIEQDKGLISVSSPDLRDPQIKRWGQDQGLQNPKIKSIQVDSSDRVWLSTSTGIEIFDPKAHRFSSLSNSTGIPFNEFFNFSYQDSLGRMYFAGLHSFIQFHPDSVSLSVSPPKIIPTYWVVNSDYRYDLTNQHSVHLQHEENTISMYFDLIDLDHIKTKKLFRYRILKGIDTSSNWIITESPEIHLSNLESGHYFIEYNASSALSSWYPMNQSIELTIAQPWYESFWFISICALLTGSIGYSVHRYRMRQLEKFVVLRNKISHDLHDDIGSTLASISVYSEVAKSSNLSKAKDILDKIGESSREIQENLNDIVWSIKSENDQIQNFEDRIRNFAGNVLTSAGISFNLHSTIGNQRKNMDMEKKRNLFLIFKESINNAIKYSNCTEINLHLSLDHDKLKMTIEDNGIGFDPENNTSYNGNGLKSMKKRAEAIHARFSIESKPDYGVKIIVEEL